MSSVYMKVTPDRYQLPLGVADTVIELAKMCNVSEWTIRASLKRDRKGDVEDDKICEGRVAKGGRR